MVLPLDGGVRKYTKDVPNKHVGKRCRYCNKSVSSLSLLKFNQSWTDIEYMTHTTLCLSNLRNKLGKNLSFNFPVFISWWTYKRIYTKKRNIWFCRYVRNGRTSLKIKCFELNYSNKQRMITIIRLSNYLHKLWSYDNYQLIRQCHW